MEIKIRFITGLSAHKELNSVTVYTQELEELFELSLN